MFKELAQVLQQIEQQGFDPTSETYGERMKDVSVPSLTAPQVSRAKQLLREYQGNYGESSSGYIMAGKGNKFYGLDKESVERNLPFTEGKIDRDEQGNIKYKPVNVEKEAVDQVQVIEEGGEVMYATPLPSNASKIPKQYYSGRTGIYDPVQNAFGGTSSRSSFGQFLKQSGESKLDNIIDNEISDEKLQKYGITRDQLKQKFVQMKDR